MKAPDARKSLEVGVMSCEIGKRVETYVKRRSEFDGGEVGGRDRRRGRGSGDGFRVGSVG